MLCFSLTRFSLGEAFGGWVGLIVSLIGVVSTTRSWMTYKQNRNRRRVHRDAEDV
jgi:hypothetical protein